MIVHTSALLQELIDATTEEYFTLEWFVIHMPNRSYGVVMLLLAALSLIPVIGVLTRLLIMFVALEVLIGLPMALPKRFMKKPLSIHYLNHMQAHVLPALRRLERSVRPRWAPILGARRLSAAIVFLVTLISLLAPIPFANVPAAFIVMLIALAYIEHDGLLLAAAHMSGIAVLVATGVVLMAGARLFEM